jgi:hypothetical protein
MRLRAKLLIAFEKEMQLYPEEVDLLNNVQLLLSETTIMPGEDGKMPYLHVIARAKCVLDPKGQNQYEVLFDFLNTPKKQHLFNAFTKQDNLVKKITLHANNNGFVFSREDFSGVYNAFLPENLIRFKKQYEFLNAEVKKKNNPAEMPSVPKNPKSDLKS